MTAIRIVYLKRLKNDNPTSTGRKVRKTADTKHGITRNNPEESVPFCMDILISFDKVFNLLPTNFRLVLNYLQTSF